MKKLFIILIIFFIFLPTIIRADLLNDVISGRIVLQVEKNGEAYYINPDNNKRYYLGRPDDAFNIMRELGLGIKHNELTLYLKNQFPDRLAGKIMLDVENKGEAYYIYPEDMRGYYLGRPIDAFNIMKDFGLGITDDDLNKISILSKNTSLTSIDELWDRYCNNYFEFCIKLPHNADYFGKIEVDEYENRIELVTSNNSKIWTIYLSYVDGEEGLEKFLQDRYGSTCGIGEKNMTKYDKVYHITLGNCFSPFAKRSYYNSNNKLAVTWSLGQACNFFINDECVDLEMGNSFEFIGKDAIPNPLCFNKPTATDIGRSIYPIYPKYKHLEFLGQFYTAYYCGEERLNEIYGNNTTYSLGSTIWLNNNPNQALINHFRDAGYKCAEEGCNNYDCKEWKLTEDIEMDYLFLIILPHMNEFKMDDCIHCG